MRFIQIFICILSVFGEKNNVDSHLNNDLMFQNYKSMSQIDFEGSQSLPSEEDDYVQPKEKKNVQQRSQQKRQQKGSKAIKIIFFCLFFSFLLFVLRKETIIQKQLQDNVSLPSQPFNEVSNRTKEKVDKVASSNKNSSFIQIDLNTNLWDLTPSEKNNLLKRYKQFMLNNKNSNKNFMNILPDKDEQAQFFLKKFQQNAQIIDWNTLSMSENEAFSYQKQINQLLTQRQHQIEGWLFKYQDFQHNNEEMPINTYNRTITKSQFYQAIQYHQITQKLINDKSNEALYNEYLLEIEHKYNISNYNKQLKACVIVPTYNNVIHNRYLWNIESILQQKYSNINVIIIDDASEDDTSAKIGKHLKWRNADPNIFTLIRSKIRNRSLYGFYYAAHKYCDLGQIIYTIDGDDELIGTHVFKIVNAVYQHQKPYTLYSIFIANYPGKLALGNNHEYPQKIKDQNKYRWDITHGYSHLRTMLSDTFLLVDAESFMMKNDEFFKLITDSAVYFCALELSCRRVKFLQDIDYWYAYNTGNNIFNQMSYRQYQKHVTDVQKKKPYGCINDYFIESEQWHKKKQ